MGRIDTATIKAAAVDQSRRPTTGTEDIADYLAHQTADRSHREVTGPLREGEGASGP